jgi:hypothetical protein
MSATGSGHRHHHGWCDHDGLRLGLLVQRRVAASAIIVGCTELDQQAVIATNDFPGIYWGKSRSHRVVGVPELATPYSLNARIKWGRDSCSTESEA